MRGKVASISPFNMVSRITPAYAGKSVLGSSFVTPCEDHPRLCGEKHPCRICVRGGAGSPPPMRGKVKLLALMPAAVRITPAYAGKSVTGVKISETSTDHPRLCGEKTKKILKQRYFFHQPASFSFSLHYT